MIPLDIVGYHKNKITAVTNRIHIYLPRDETGNVRWFENCTARWKMSREDVSF